MNENNDTAVVMVACDDCGHLVPEPNLAIHQAHACGGRARAAPPQTPERNHVSEPQRHEQLTTPLSDSKPPARERSNGNENESASTASSFQEAITVDDVATPTTNNNNAYATTNATPIYAAPNSNHNNTENFVDLTGDTPPPQEWACSVCTLLNPMTSSVCSACMHSKDGVRPADASRRERLIGGPMPPAMMPSSPSSALPSGATSGALLGGVLGAAHAYMGGRPMGSAALEGAMTGFVGGALVGDVVAGMNSPSSSRATTNNNMPVSNMPVSSARTGASMGLPTYPSMYRVPDSSRNRRRMQPRSSVRVVRRSTSNGGSYTVYSSGGSNMDPDPFLNFMMQSMASRATDNMSYEELLRAFGDGTENMGANEEDISHLPTATIQDPNKELPQDQKQCCICLEDFSAGEERKTLPCLHGFHSECVDKWLRSNGSCPICKHTVSS